MKAADVIAGTRAERKVEVAMPSGKTVPALIRPISCLEEAASIEYGIRFAKDRGVPDALHGHPLFDTGMRAFTVFTATLDIDSPADKRETFFASPEKVAEDYHPEWVLYLYHRWEIWQEQCSPLIRVKSTNDLFESCANLAGDGDDFGFFCGLSPSTRAICTRFSAKLALGSPELKSFFSSRQENLATTPAQQ